MRTLLIFIIICTISCKDNTNKKGCKITFDIPRKPIISDKIVTEISVCGNILKVSVTNLRNDTLNFAVPHLIFAKKEEKGKELPGIVVKEFIPNIVTDKVVNYYITKIGVKKNINIDSSKSRDMGQFEFKLAPKEKYVSEYFINCKESNPERYKIFFFESNKFDNIRYRKIKYPQNAYIEIR